MPMWTPLTIDECMMKKYKTEREIKYILRRLSLETKMKIDGIEIIKSETVKGEAIAAVIVNLKI